MLKERCGVKYIFHISCVKWIFFVFIIGTPTYKMSTLFFVITSLAAFQNVFIPQRIPRIFTFLLFLCFNLYFKPSGIYWSNIYFCYFVKHSVDIKLFRTRITTENYSKIFLSCSKGNAATITNMDFHFIYVHCHQTWKHLK